MIDAITTLGKVDAPGAAALSIAAISLLPKPFNTASSHLVADSLVDDPDTYIKDSDSVIAELLNIL